MPNHVHLLVCLLGDTDLLKQCRSWKKFTAGKINQVLGQTGRFWQKESFDHLVRSPEQFCADPRIYQEKSKPPSEWCGSKLLLFSLYPWLNADPSPLTNIIADCIERWNYEQRPQKGRYRQPPNDGACHRHPHRRPPTDPQRHR